MAYTIEEVDGQTHAYDTALEVKEENGKYIVYADFKVILAIFPKADVRKISSNEAT
ncbi:hypothetical protein [Pseudomonas syringae]|uniref:hypothetical protein n=1 Tax=Pseudomonas syringae TaxID=317 RepID=UPI0015E170A8|nr:hypothetical protein [Pseudomonas syringae]